MGSATGPSSSEIGTTGIPAAQIEAGLARMAGSSVVICGLAHQCALTLPRTLRRVDQLREMFGQSAVVVFENESRDKTLRILRAWAGKRERITILSRPFPAELAVPGERNERDYPEFSMARIRRMVWARNQYLNHVREHHDPDYLITLDFDLYRISLEGVASTFGAEKQWDAVFSNSRAFRRYKLWRRVYWDTFAFKPQGDTGAQTRAQILASQERLRGLQPGDPWLPVASAFGGLGIYRWQAIRPFRYQCVQNDDIEVRARCEHVTLHSEMANAGNERLFINPAQIIYYDTVIGKLARGVSAVWIRMLKRLGLYQRHRS